MKYIVTGGTHLGIVSCYGEKEFEALNEAELIRQVKEAAKKATNGTWKVIDSSVLGCYLDLKRIIYTFTTEGTQSFEFYFERIDNEVKT